MFAFFQKEVHLDIQMPNLVEDVQSFQFCVLIHAPKRKVNIQLPGKSDVVFIKLAPILWNPLYCCFHHCVWLMTAVNVQVVARHILCHADFFYFALSIFVCFCDGHRPVFM